MCPSAGSSDGRADEKMADEICGSLKLMRGEQTERKEGEDKFIVSVFAIANKRKRLQFAEPVYSFCQRERVREQETDCEERGDWGNEEAERREKVRLRGCHCFCIASASDMLCSVCSCSLTS